MDTQKQTIRQSQESGSNTAPKTAPSYSRAKQVFDKAAQRLVQQTGKAAYEFDAENSPVINELLRYFAQLPGGDCIPAKGILLAGNVGSGKTLLFEIFFHLVRPLRPFYKTTARQVAKDYADEGLTALRRYVNQFKQTPAGLVPVDFFFDDLGAEDNKKHYGNEANVMAEIIYDRYELFIRHNTRTHFTTNLTPEELEDKYGTRVYSRLCHICNFLVLGNGKNSTDRRMT